MKRKTCTVYVCRNGQRVWLQQEAPKYTLIPSKAGRFTEAEALQLVQWLKEDGDQTATAEFGQMYDDVRH